MKIGIEASAAFRTQKTGISYYTHNLIRALATEMPDDDLILCYLSFITRKPQRFSPSLPNIHYRRISLIPGKIYNAFDHYLVGLPIDLLAGLRADVFIFPNFFRWPLWLCRTSVVVIHDMAFIDTPEHLTDRHRKYLSKRVPQSVRKATHVIAVSENTKQQLIRHYGTDPEKITVVTPAIDQQKYTPSDPKTIEDVKAKYGITGDYLLYLGTIEPRKNITGIIQAYKQLSEKERDAYQLVLAGGKGWLDEKINELIRSLPKGSVIRTGYIDDNDKPALYTGATLFLYPSHYEGWGMQILEAMACGTPVLTAQNSSLSEAGGEAAAYVKTTDPTTISRLVSELLENPKKLASMRELGFIQAKKFTWIASAKRLAAVIVTLNNSKK